MAKSNLPEAINASPCPASVSPSQRTRRGVISFSTLVLVLVALSCTVLVVRRMTDDTPVINLIADHGVVAGTDTAPATAPLVQQAIGTATARDVRGKVVPLVPKGEPTIVMMSSVTCSWCKRALKDFGEMAAGRPIPHLTLLTLEGASDGMAMLDKESLTGARLVGPVGSKEQVLLTFRYPGTPTFVAVDKNGRVIRTIPGYPVRPELERLFAVMVGDADAP